MKALTLLVAGVMAAVLCVAMVPSPAHAKLSDLIGGKVCDNGNNLAGCDAATKAQCEKAVDKAACIAGAKDLGSNNGYLSFLINSIIAVGAVVSIIFILVGAINFVTSTGDPAKAKGAQETVLYAVIGLIVMIIARGIVGFVLEKVQP